MKEHREAMECYSEDNKRWKQMYADMEKKHEDYVKQTTAEINDLKEQLRDVMFYFEAQTKIEESPLKDEIHGASVNVDESSVPSTSKSKAGRRKKRWTLRNPNSKLSFNLEMKSIMPWPPVVLHYPTYILLYFIEVFQSI